MFEIQGVKFFNSSKAIDNVVILSRSGPEGMKQAKAKIWKHACKKFSEVEKKLHDRKNIHRSKLIGSDPNLTVADPPIIVTDDTQKIADVGWELLYDTVNRTEQGASETIDVLDVTTDFDFEVTLPNEEMKIHEVPSTSTADFTFLEITGGINISDKWMHFNKFYLIEQVFAAVIRKYLNRKAVLAYGVITGLTGVDEAFDTTIIETINNALVNIENNMEADGTLIGESVSYYILTARTNFALVNKAVVSSLILPNDNNSLNQLDSIPRGIIKSSKVPTANIWVVVPGLQNLHGVWKLLSEESERDPRLLGNTHFWSSWQNWALFDPNQIRKLALS